MNLRHTMILGISTTVLLIISVFSFWLYNTYQADVIDLVKNKISGATETAEKLVSLERKDLNNVARSIAISPILRGALQTFDKATIDDVLQSLVLKNKLALVAIKEDGKVIYTSEKTKIDLTKDAKIYTEFPIQSGSFELLIARVPDKKLLDSWSSILGVSFLIRDAEGKVVVHNIEPEYKEVIDARRTEKHPQVAVAQGKRFYVYSRDIKDNKSKIEAYSPKAQYWANFTHRRNSLIMIGGSLLLLGIILSIVLAKLFIMESDRRVKASSGFAGNFSDEIERLKGELLLNTNKL